MTMLKKVIYGLFWDIFLYLIGCDVNTNTYPIKKVGIKIRIIYHMLYIFENLNKVSIPRLNQHINV